MKTKQIQFHEDTLIAYQDDSENWFVAVRPIAEAIGVNTESAVRGVKSNPILRDVQTVQYVRDASNRQNEMVCIPIQYVQGWLFTIEVGKVKEEAREKLLTYQRECYKVLHDHFAGKTAQVVKNQKRRCELLRERDHLKNSMFLMRDRIKEIEAELQELDTDTFLQLDLFKAPKIYELEESL